MIIISFVIAIENLFNYYSDKMYNIIIKKNKKDKVIKLIIIS